MKQAQTSAAKISASDCQHSAVVLAGLLQAIDFLDTEDRTPNALTCLIQVATERAEKLANDLEGLKL